MENAVRASVLVTCLVDLFFPEAGVAMVRLLKRLGVAVDFPRNQTCCGLPLFNSGYHREAARVARHTVPLFRGSEHVVVPSGSCAWMVKKEYPGLLNEEPALRDEAQALAARTYELSQ
ncbi:MAG: heterodisulfide reductase-related iron-sulfur binding cluster, partial [Candidatus Methylomirabilia bacterium]